MIAIPQCGFWFDYCLIFVHKNGKTLLIRHNRLTHMYSLSSYSLLSLILDNVQCTVYYLIVMYVVIYSYITIRSTLLDTRYVRLKRSFNYQFSSLKDQTYLVVNVWSKMEVKTKLLKYNRF